MQLVRPTPEHLETVAAWYAQAGSQFPQHGELVMLAVGKEGAPVAFASVRTQGPCVAIDGLVGRVDGFRFILRLCEQLAVATMKFVVCLAPLADEALKLEGYTQLSPDVWALVPGHPNIPPLAKKQDTKSPKKPRARRSQNGKRKAKEEVASGST